MRYSDLHRRSIELTKLAQIDAYQQKTEWSCSAGTLKAVIQHYGIDISEEEIIKAVGAREGRGAETTDIVEGARRLGFDASEGSFASLAEAKKTLKSGVPIIADIQSFNHPGKGHYIVLTGFKPGKGFIAMDPNTKGKTAVDNFRVISEEKLEEIWWDRAMAPPHELMPKWGVMVKPRAERDLTKTGGVRTDELINAVRVVFSKKPSPEVLKGWSRHSAMNLGAAKSQAAQALKLKKGPWVQSSKEEAKDAVTSALFAALPPTHHTKKEMAELLAEKATHRDWFRFGAGGKLEKTALTSPVPPPPPIKPPTSNLAASGVQPVSTPTMKANPTAQDRRDARTIASRKFVQYDSGHKARANAMARSEHVTAGSRGGATDIAYEKIANGKQEWESHPMDEEFSVYHGSPKGGLKHLEPTKGTSGHRWTGDTNVVHLTGDIPHAASYGLPRGSGRHSWSLEIGKDKKRVNKHLVVLPKSKAFLLRRKASIYKVPTRMGNHWVDYDIPQNNEMVTKERLPVREEMRDTVKNLFARTGVRVVLMPDKEFYKKYPKTKDKTANGDMLAYFRDNPKKLEEYKARQAAKKKRKAYMGKNANDPVKEKFTLHGIPLSLEWREGETRKYFNHDPLKKKSTGTVDYDKKMKADYGYVRGVMDADGEELDVYLGPNRESEKVFVLEKLRSADKSFDENKIMLGYDSMAESKKSYLQHQGKDEMGKVREVTLEQFKKEFMGKKKTAFSTGGAVGGAGSGYGDGAPSPPDPRGGKMATGDMFGWAARRRAKSESARSTNIGPKLAAFSDELQKIASTSSSSAGTAFEALGIGSKAGGIIGGLRESMKDEEPEKIRRVIKGVGAGALIGALVALGMQRNAVGKNTLPKLW